MSRLARVAAAALAVGSPFGAAWADWPAFRGPDQSGVATVLRLPEDWSRDEVVAWEAKLPGRGPASPIVVGNQVFVTASDGTDQDRLVVLAFDAATGKPAWTRDFWATGRTLTHPSSAVAANSPAAEGDRLFAFYSSNDVVALSTDGKLAWYRGLAYDYPQAGNDVGMSSSLAVADGTVVAQVEGQGDSFAVGIDAATGQTRWRVDRPKKANWASPIVLRKPGGGDADDPDGTPDDGGAVVLLQSPDNLTAVDAVSGDVLWKLDVACDGVSSSSYVDGVLYVPSEGVTALALPDPRSAPSILWRERRLSPGAASLLVKDKTIYTVNRSGVLTASSAEDGSRQWQLRLKGNYWASPVLVGDRLICANYEGIVQVVDLSGDKGEIVTERDFGEPFQATPAVGSDGLYFRSDSTIWKVGALK